MEQLLAQLEVQLLAVQGLQAIVCLGPGKGTASQVGASPTHHLALRDALCSSAEQVQALQDRIAQGHALLEQERNDLAKARHLCEELGEQGAALEHVLEHIPGALKERVLRSVKESASRKQSLEEAGAAAREAAPTKAVVGGPASTAQRAKAPGDKARAKTSPSTGAPSTAMRTKKGAPSSGTAPGTASGTTQKQRLDRMQLAVDPVTAEEFARVPSYLVGRLTLDRVNGLVAEFNLLVRDKHAIFRIPPTRMTKVQRELYWEHRKHETEETRDLAWCTEEDVKTKEAWSSSTFRYDPAGRAVLALLRQLGRIKEVRGGGHLRLVIQRRRGDLA